MVSVHTANKMQSITVLYTTHDLCDSSLTHTFSRLFSVHLSSFFHILLLLCHTNTQSRNLSNTSTHRSLFLSSCTTPSLQKTHTQTWPLLHVQYSNVRTGTCTLSFQHTHTHGKARTEVNQWLLANICITEFKENTHTFTRANPVTA